MKRMGFSDRQLGDAARRDRRRRARAALGARRPSRRTRWSTRAPASFRRRRRTSTAATTRRARRRRPARKSVVILGSGPNRIGQGVEFDYCCVRAVMALREQGYETIMINSNPETVSTDFDISDKLYFEPLTLEDVLEIVEREEPEGVIVQLGGQTPLKLTRRSRRPACKILGTSPDAIDIAEDRRRFEQDRARARTSSSRRTARRRASTKRSRSRSGSAIPVLVRPSYVLGGRAMQIVYDEPSLREYFATRRARVRGPAGADRLASSRTRSRPTSTRSPTATRVVIGGDHAAHRGRRHSLRRLGVRAAAVSDRRSGHATTMREHTVALAKALGVVGLINVQYAIKDGIVYVLEVNPRASRTIPFVSKAIGVPLASLAARVMMGETLDEIGFTEEIVPPYVSVKEAVFPFNKFREFDPMLGPEMRSTGEVMGISDSFGSAFAKAQLAARQRAAARGRDVHHGERLRQADGDADRAAVPRDGLQDRTRRRERRSYCAGAASRRDACSRCTRAGRTAST